MTKEERDELFSEVSKDLQSRKNTKKTWGPPSNEEGDFYIRLLPPLKRKNEKLYYGFYKTHWVGKTPYLCLSQTLIDKNGNLHSAEDCPVCSYVRKLYKIAGTDKDSDEWKLAGSLSARDRYLFRAVVRGSEDETIPQFWETSKTMFAAIHGFMTTDNPEKNFGVIIDPIDGRDFILTKKGKGSYSNYDNSLPSNKQTPIFQDKEKIKAVLVNAEKLEYNSIFEFSNFDTMEKSLKDYISGDVETPISKPQEKEEHLPTPKKVEKKVIEDDADDQIDDLLNELF